jgi:hypothetical protein
MVSWDTDTQPELQITSPSELLSHVRKSCSKPTSYLLVKNLRDAVPAPHSLPAFLEELENKGDVLVMRSLGPFIQAELPKLGRKNFQGLGILDPAPTGGGTRMKAIYLDSVRVEMNKKGRPVGRVDDGES